MDVHQPMVILERFLKPIYESHDLNVSRDLILKTRLLTRWPLKDIKVILQLYFRTHFTTKYLGVFGLPVTHRLRH